MRKGLNGLGDGELRAVESPSLFESCRGYEAAHTNVLLLSGPRYLCLLGFGVVRSDGLAYHARKLASCEFHKSFLHRRDGSTASVAPDASADRPGTLMYNSAVYSTS